MKNVFFASLAVNIVIASSSMATPPWYQYTMKACEDLKRGVPPRTVSLMLHHQNTPEKRLTETTLKTAKKAVNETCTTVKDKTFMKKTLEKIEDSSSAPYYRQ